MFVSFYTILKQRLNFSGAAPPLILATSPFVRQEIKVDYE
jgi:hypothetical protein